MKTERSVRRAEGAGDTIPEQAGVYVPPRPVASLSEHRTMDIKAIRLAAEVDPRQQMTELRLSAPPLKKDKTWIAPLALALLAVGFIALWWVTPNPLPLATVSSPERPSAPAIVPETAAVKAPVPRAAPAPAPNVSQPEPLPSAVAVPNVPPARPAVTVPRATATEPQPSSAPHRSKQVRDPWLE